MADVDEDIDEVVVNMVHPFATFANNVGCCLYP